VPRLKLTFTSAKGVFGCEECQNQVPCFVALRANPTLEASPHLTPSYPLVTSAPYTMASLSVTSRQHVLVSCIAVYTALYPTPPRLRRRRCPFWRAAGW
jgi:hypothetical protein